MISSPYQLSPYFDFRVTLNSGTLPAYKSIIPADPSRVCIIFSAQAGNPGTLYVSPKTMPVTLTGIALVNGGDPLIIDMQTMGGLSQQEWYVSAATGGGNLTIIESFYRPYEPSAEESALTGA